MPPVSRLTGDVVQRKIYRRIATEPGGRISKWFEDWQHLPIGF
jgi:hypothetical protein